MTPATLPATGSAVDHSIMHAALTFSFLLQGLLSDESEVLDGSPRTSMKKPSDLLTLRSEVTGVFTMAKTPFRLPKFSSCSKRLLHAGVSASCT